MQLNDFYIKVTVRRYKFLFNPLNAELNPICHLLALLGTHHILHVSRVRVNNQPDALIIQIYSVIKLYMFRVTSLTIIRSFLLYIRHW
jgi:hypothetical protein